MSYWLSLSVALLAFSGVMFALLVLALGVGILEALAIVIVLVAALLYLLSKESIAPDLVMRESLWNTPEDDEEIKP